MGFCILVVMAKWMDGWMDGWMEWVQLRIAQINNEYELSGLLAACLLTWACIGMAIGAADMG